MQKKAFSSQEAMAKKDFHFPAIEIVGNPTVKKKEYDEGYLLLDADRRLFHLKQVKRTPLCPRYSVTRRTDIRAPVSDGIQKQKDACLSDRCQ